MSKWTWFVVLFSRVTLNLAVRVTYPFLPAIARGLGISFEKAGLLVAARHLVGLTGALWGFWRSEKDMLGVCYLDCLEASVGFGNGVRIFAFLWFFRCSLKSWRSSCCCSVRHEKHTTHSAKKGRVNGDPAFNNSFFLGGTILVRYPFLAFLGCGFFGF